MRDIVWGVVAMVGSFVWACSGKVTQPDVTPGGAAGMTENTRAGATQGGATSGVTDGGEAGVGAVAADGGASGEGVGGGAGGGAGAGGSGGEVSPGHFWDCEGGSSGATSPVPSTEPSPLPSGAEATLEQLAGDWLHDSSVDYNGDFDYFHFDVDGTGSQQTVTNYWEVTWSTSYVGTIALSDHLITLASTAGYSDSSNPLANGPGHPGIYTREDLPPQTLRFGYSYDATADTLYVNNVVCAEPVAFVRVRRW